MGDSTTVERIEAIGTGGELMSVLPNGLTKSDLVSYMRSSRVILVARTRLPDRINPDGKPVSFSFLSDGRFIWSGESLAYVERYDLALPVEFLDHVAKHVERWGNVPPELDEDALQAAYDSLASGSG